MFWVWVSVDEFCPPSLKTLFISSIQTANTILLYICAQHNCTLINTPTLNAKNMPLGVEIVHPHSNTVQYKHTAGNAMERATQQSYVNAHHTNKNKKSSSYVIETIIILY